MTWDGGEWDCGHDELIGGDHCIASTQTNPTLQTQALTLTDPSLQTQSGGGSVDEVADIIIVIGRRLAGPAVVILRWPGISGMLPALGTLREIQALPVNPEEPEESEECTTAKVGDLNGELSPEDQQRIADFLNSPAAEGMWIDTGYDGPFLNQALRSEQAGFLFPDGSFQRADWDGGMCGGPLPLPPSLPAGTILVHTHPATRNEPLTHCNTTAPYRNRPSNTDLSVIDIVDEFTYGLIIDADGFIIFTGDPNQIQHIGGEDGKCGFNRI